MKTYFILALVLFFIFILFVHFIKAQVTKHQIKKAGNKGEKIFSNNMEHILHKDDIMLKNVELKYDESKTEIDTLIVNKNGVFIFEVKYYNGRLYGNEDDFYWTKIKTTPGGQKFEKQVKNPVKQVKREIYILSHILKQHKIKTWVQGYAYLLNNTSPVESEHLVKSYQEIDQIIHTSSDTPLSQKQIAKIKSIF